MKVIKLFLILAILLAALVGSFWVLEIFPREQLEQYALKTYGVLGIFFLASLGLSAIAGKAKPTNSKNGPQF